MEFGNPSLLLNPPPASPNADYDPRATAQARTSENQGRIARDADRSRPQYAAQSEASSTDQKRLILKLRACRAQFSPRELSCLRRYCNVLISFIRLAIEANEVIGLRMMKII